MLQLTFLLLKRLCTYLPNAASANINVTRLGITLTEHSFKRRHTYIFVSGAGRAMYSLCFPEGPYEPGLALHRERGRKLTRAESVRSSSADEVW